MKYYYVIEIITQEDLSDVIGDPFLKVLDENIQQLTHQCQGVIDEITVTIT